MKTREQAWHEWLQQYKTNQIRDREYEPGPMVDGPDVSEAFRGGWYAAFKEIVRLCEDCSTCDEARIKAQRFG